MSSERTAIGFTISQLITRVIPGSILFSFIFVSAYVVRPEIVSDMPEDTVVNVITEPYSWLFVLVISLVIGESIDISRRIFEPFPNDFRMYLYNDEPNKAFLTTTQYWMITRNEAYDSYKKSGNSSDLKYGQWFTRNRYAQATTIWTLISLIVISNAGIEHAILFFSSCVGLSFAVIFIGKSINPTTGSRIRSTGRPQPNGYFTNGTPDGFIQEIRKQYNLDDEFSDPKELFLLVHRHLESNLTLRTQKLQTLHIFFRNTQIAVVFGGLGLAIIIWVQLSYVFAILVVIFVFPVVLYISMVSDGMLDISDKYTRAIILEYLADIGYTPIHKER
ncbi:hypothetical protein [Natronorubrum tibetense]|uniref:hypothetical protein n=1 Tax=Natronorubrum tibetense TaxID=63128 RepID=UPI0012692C99|nr:hypothetical protein [Natronorubrum tibetense]